MALDFIYRRPELALAIGLALGCSKQSEPETPAQPYPGTYPQQQGQYPAGQYPEQQGQYPAQQQPYPQQQQPYPQQQQPYPAQQQPYPAQQQPYPATPTTPAPTTPGALPPSALPPTAPSAPLATPLDPSMAAAVQPVITQLGSTKAPAGSKPIGSLMAANFQTGQQLEAQVQMEPGKCYTVVGAALPPVAELDIKLVAVTPLAGMAPVLAVDNTTGTQAVLGEKPNCFKWAWPIAAPVKVVVAVTSGQGLAAAQLFGK
ncbi:MAG TPA: hypothetical protein VMG12_08875 [Polyangiaceae bacterium]|nr:hypothetical protein [Polyangiaceae bacterium]